MSHSHFFIVGCKPLSVPSDFNTSFPLSLLSLRSSPSNMSSSPDNTTIADTNRPRTNGSDGVCVRNPSVFKEDQDVLSVRFAVANGNISLPSEVPTMLSLDLDSAADSGGTLTVQLDLNIVSVCIRCLTESQHHMYISGGFYKTVFHQEKLPS